MKKRPTSFRAIAIQVTALTTALWLCFMILLTWAVAEDFFHQIDAKIRSHYSKSVVTRDPTDPDSAPELPGTFEVQMLERLNYPYLYLRDVKQLFPFVRPQMPGSMSSTDWLWDKWDLQYGCDFSLIYLDENNDVLMTSGNRMWFSYVSEESWINKDLEPQGYAWVDLDAIDGAADTMQNYLGYCPGFGSTGSSMFLTAIRVTGWFEDNQFHPTKLERAWYTDPSGMVTKEDMALFNSLDARKKLEWDLLIEADVSADQPLVTIYGWDVDGIYGDYQKNVTVDGKTYPNLTQMRLSTGCYTGSKRNLWESVSFATATFQYSYGKFTYALTVRSWPVQYAMLRLMPAYLVITAVSALALGLILHRIRRNLSMPLERLNAAFQIGAPIEPDAHWTELRTLEQHYTEMHSAMTQVQQETIRLENALNYATEAEQKRKELISNLGHELKTPLAVVHSYCEGLQSNIAPEKQEQYIQTILNETTRMDAMVMQMLELSRLEAGKTKLRTETFSLREWIRETAEKLTPLTQAKNLTVRMELPDEYLMNGDPARMEQVITNYMSNAIKYTPEGGNILIRATNGENGIFFSITNTAPHLPDVALERVYESFYRIDTARTDKSTGLGLAIVRGIMTLHGYTCYALNSSLDGKEAVEFGFFPRS